MVMFWRTSPRVGRISAIRSWMRCSVASCWYTSEGWNARRKKASPRRTVSRSPPYSRSSACCTLAYASSMPRTSSRERACSSRMRGSSFRTKRVPAWMLSRLTLSTRSLSSPAIRRERLRSSWSSRGGPGASVLESVGSSPERAAEERRRAAQGAAESGAGETARAAAERLEGAGGRGQAGSRRGRGMRQDGGDGRAGGADGGTLRPQLGLREADGDVERSDWVVVEPHVSHLRRVLVELHAGEGKQRQEPQR